jgi:hypothetical protein
MNYIYLMIEKCLLKNFLKSSHNISKSFIKINNVNFSIKNIGNINSLMFYITGRQVYREVKIGEKKPLTSEVEQEYKINFENILMSLKIQKVPTSAPRKFNSSLTDSDIEIEKVKIPQNTQEDATSSEDSNEDSPVSFRRLALRSNFNLASENSHNSTILNFSNNINKIKSYSANKKIEEFENFHLIDDSTTDLSEDELSQSDIELIDTFRHKNKKSEIKEK